MSNKGDYNKRNINRAAFLVSFFAIIFQTLYRLKQIWYNDFQFTIFECLCLTVKLFIQINKNEKASVYCIYQKLL